jgi:hypothetical protein
MYATEFALSETKTSFMGAAPVLWALGGQGVNRFFR